MSISVLKSAHVAKTFAISLGISLAVFLAAGVGPVYAANVNFNSKRNCDTNAIINCGAMSISELQAKYRSDTKAQAVYSWYGISASTISSLPSTAVAGSVTKAGNVEVNGKVVAKDLISAGYHQKSVSTKVVSGGVTFYNSSPSASFLSDRIDAFVVLNDKGQFVTAIMASCGNPVKATNVVPTPTPKPTPKPTPTPTPTPTPHTPTPPVNNTQVVVVQNNNTNVNNNTVNLQTAAATKEVAELPKTGPGSIATLFGGVTLLAGTAHQLYIRRKNSLGL